MLESCALEEVRFRAAFCVPRSIPAFSVPSCGSPFRVLQNWTDSLGSFALPQDPDHDPGPGTRTFTGRHLAARLRIFLAPRRFLVSAPVQG
ncbi:hypothetical protein NDU88_001217 [Pleurodeles waltl]|uniref:Uncharacterized protein n=1 Tax=Pleurodeles waltl TaxID=8319 RepID=A0AAV7LAC6_PLEWA|nr:hypothetical protein NDU88_001217 [Pleurodeles waltl]